MAQLRPKPYIVTAGGQARLVRALTRAGAINYVARGSIEARLATPDEVIDLLRRGVEVEEALIEEQTSSLFEEAPITDTVRASRQ